MDLGILQGYLGPSLSQTACPRMIILLCQRHVRSQQRRKSRLNSGMPVLIIVGFICEDCSGGNTHISTLKAFEFWSACSHNR